VDTLKITTGAVRTLGEIAIRVKEDRQAKTNSRMQAIGEGLEVAGIFNDTPTVHHMRCLLIFGIVLD
jgi:hypothetical protein